jgi:hypothetical protein
MKSQRHSNAGLPAFTNVVVSLSIAGEEDARCLEHPTWERQGGRLFLVGKVPRGCSTNDWCEGIAAAVAWEAVTDYMVFDSAAQYGKRVGVYEGRKRKR